MSAKSKFRSVRRAIEQTIFKINHSMNTTQVDTLLYTADEATTLVRTILDLTFSQGAEGAAYIGTMAFLQIVRKGKAVVSPDQAEGDVGVASLAIPWFHMGMIPADRAYRVLVDLKAMRKLKSGDKIYLTDESNVTTDTPKIRGSVRLFFKEA